MQRYAESHRKESSGQDAISGDEDSLFLGEINRFKAVYGHYLLDELPGKEAARYQSMKSIVRMDYKNLNPKISSSFVQLMIGLGDCDTAKKPYADLIKQ
jgi:hypothetical protein